ncbi:hypothetical protein Tco_0974342 [Tanacetum coccineum]|uniref:Uncharacterized protein n=1 Tax=Tanacetum coccineum TaxID=301880 RepID=A0ABQ5EBA5_9ASTR
MLILLVQGKLTNLNVEDRLAFGVSLEECFTRSIIIQRRVEDLQLGVESYQKKLNITKPDTYRSDLKCRDAYTTYSNPRGFIYQNKDKKNKLLRIDELHKFSDGLLDDVRTALNDCLKGIRMEYLPKTIWRQNDKERQTYIQGDRQTTQSQEDTKILEKLLVGNRTRSDLATGDCDEIPKRPTMYLNLWSYKAVRLRYSNPIIQPEPEGSTQGYPLVSVEVLSDKVLKSKEFQRSFHHSDTERLSRSDEVLKLKNFKKDATLKLFKSTNQERCSRSHSRQAKEQAQYLKSMITTSNHKLTIEVKDYKLKTKVEAGLRTTRNGRTSFSIRIRWKPLVTRIGIPLRNTKSQGAFGVSEIGKNLLLYNSQEPLAPELATALVYENAGPLPALDLQLHLEFEFAVFTLKPDSIILNGFKKSNYHKHLDSNQKKFVNPPFEEEILTFIRELGYPGNIKLISDVKVDTLPQPCRTFGTIINKCLSDLVFHIEYKESRKNKYMFYLRFKKVIINYFMSQDQSIPRRNKVDWHMANVDLILTTMRFIPQHEVVQRYGAIRPDYLTNPAMKESEAYKSLAKILLLKGVTKTEILR